jgi:hypothetical protein
VLYFWRNGAIYEGIDHTRETAVCFGKGIFAAAIIILGGVFSPVMSQHPRSLRARLVGAWRFESASQRMADGTVRPDPQTGPNGKGYIIYTETGQMCSMIANPDRTKWKSEAGPQEEELRNACAGLVAYCGIYEVNEKEKSVIHRIEFDRVPNLAGTDRKRYISLSGNRLMLQPANLPEGVRAWEVVWKRVEK